MRIQFFGEIKDCKVILKDGLGRRLKSTRSNAESVTFAILGSPGIYLIQINAELFQGVLKAIVKY
jgi:hypothetical protein